MLDPAQLFRLETDTTSHDLRASTMVVALGGFIDAGFAQKLMSQHILGTLEHTVVASFDLDQLLDYRGRRPVMTFDRDRTHDIVEGHALMLDREVAHRVNGNRNLAV